MTAEETDHPGIAWFLEGRKATLAANREEWGR